MNKNLSCLTSICGTTGLVKMEDGSIIRTEKVGRVISMTVADIIDRIISISDAAYVPSQTTNFLSVRCFKLR